MLVAGKLLLEAKPNRPGLLTLLDQAGNRDAEVPLASMKRNELFGLANELCARGFEVDLRDMEVPPRPSALDVFQVLHMLGADPPYAAYAEALALGQSATYRAGKPKPTEGI